MDSNVEIKNLIRRVTELEKLVYTLEDRLRKIKPTQKEKTYEHFR
jgi:hypothetical protein